MDKACQKFCPWQLKYGILRTKAWPSALHAAPATHVSDPLYTKLRSGAINGLRLRQAGVNPSLVLELWCHPTHDPEYYALLQSLRMLRKEISIDHASAIMPEVALTPRRQRLPGPIGVICSRLENIGWSRVLNTCWADHEGNYIDLYLSPIQ